MNNLVLSTDYQKIFDSKLAIITGVSRSGTSILSRTIGSFEDVIYLHEPIIIRLLTLLLKDDCNGSQGHLNITQMMQSILFEDYYLQLLHGRNLNFKRSDNSFIGHYQDLRSIKKKWKNYERRNDLLDEIFRGKYLFLLKINEIHPLIPLLQSIFKGLKIVHIVRDGNAIISSSKKRGWYTDDFLNSNTVQWMHKGKIKTPWFVPEADIQKFATWNAETRIAFCWRHLIQNAKSQNIAKEEYLELRYEDLITDTQHVSEVCENFLKRQPTKITSKQIEAVKKHNVTQHNNQSEKVAESERPLFIEFMRELGY